MITLEHLNLLHTCARWAVYRRREQRSQNARAVTSCTTDNLDIERSLVSTDAGIPSGLFQRLQGMVLVSFLKLLPLVRACDGADTCDREGNSILQHGGLLGAGESSWLVLENGRASGPVLESAAHTPAPSGLGIHLQRHLVLNGAHLLLHTPARGLPLRTCWRTGALASKARQLAQHKYNTVSTPVRLALFWGQGHRTHTFASATAENMCKRAMGKTLVMRGLLGMQDVKDDPAILPMSHDDAQLVQFNGLRILNVLNQQCGADVPSGSLSHVRNNTWQFRTVQSPTKIRVVAYACGQVVVWTGAAQVPLAVSFSYLGALSGRCFSSMGPVVATWGSHHERLCEKRGYR